MQLIRLLLDAAEQTPDTAISFLDESESSYGALATAAARFAAGAIAHGVKPGDRVVLLVGRMSDFFPAYWGTLWAGATPVPLIGPRGASPEEERRVQRVIALCGGPVVIDDALAAAVPFAHAVGSWMADTPHPAPMDSSAPGLIQFSSGSTGHPKGVVLSQSALLANVRQTAKRLSLVRGEAFLNWVPHFHDMGLIGSHLYPTYLQMRQVRMQPARFLRDPIGWLVALSEHRITAGTTTNFALARVTDAVRARGLPELDLSSLRYLLNGGEPISADVCRAFSRVTRTSESVHQPAYGLAEMCVGVASSPEPGLRTLRHEDREVVCHGPPLAGIRMRLVDEQGEDVAPGEVGRLLLDGPNAYDGYLGEEPRRGWVDTGDLALFSDGELAIVGRVKETLIVNGRNLMPHDIERVANAVDGVRPGGAIAVVDERSGVSGFSLLVSTETGEPAAPILWKVRQVVAGQVGADPVLVLPIDKVPRTTSGKPRRTELAKRLAAGAFDDSVDEADRVLVRRLWSTQLGQRLAPEDDDTPFRALGGSSVQAVQLVTRIEEELGIAPDLALLVDGDTIRKMAHILERHRPEPRGEGVARVAGPVAIVGLALRVPGTDTWERLVADAKAGRSHIGAPPADRWVAPYVGGFVDDVARFDAESFGVTADEARAMDPQQRMVLELAHELLEPLGDARDVGVFVGAGSHAYIEVVADHVGEGLHPNAMAGNLLNMIAARVAHHHDLQGPALSVDTACSSGLVALHLAAQSLAAGECRYAIAGGVHLNLTPTGHRLFELAGALSPSGQCRPFHPDADGTVPGEGAVLFLLQPADQARAEGRAPIAIVRGTAMNNDGASLGVMAPNPAGQEAVIRRALRRARVDASEVVYIEAHGTGTPVGDSVESAVLRRTYPHGPRIGSVKATTGHLLSAAGAVGLARALGEVEPGELAAVSSFGFGGTNAHAIVERGHGLPASPPPRRGERHWLGEEAGAAVPPSGTAVRPPAPPSTLGWVHVVRQDPGGGMIWRPAPRGDAVSFAGQRVLVTGGTGALGRHVLRWLGDQGAEPVALARRDPGDLDAPVICADLADDGAVATLVAEHHGRFDAVFHLAGGLSPNALAAKTGGLALLDGLAASRNVLFSSISAVLPGLDAGIEAYADANRALDAWAEQTPLDAVSIAWPPWTEGGLAEGVDWASRGVTPVSPARGLAVLAHALTSAERQVVVLDRPSEASGPVPDTVREWLFQEVATSAEVPIQRFDPAVPLTSLGIDSMLALDLLRGLEERLGRKLPTTLVYEAGSAQGILDAIEQGVTRTSVSPQPPTGEVSAVRALLPSQQTFVVQKAYFPDLPGNTLMAIRIAPGLSPDSLEAAVAPWVARHPALATCLAQVAGRWAQVPGPAPELRLVDEVDIATVHAEPFELAGPLVRVIFDGTTLVVNGHHSVVDAWSVRNAFEDLVALARQVERGDEPSLPALRTTHEEVADAIRAVPSGDPRWWRARYLEPVPPLTLAWRAPLDAPAHGPPILEHVRLTVDETAGVEAAARRLGVSLPALTLAAWFRVLSRHSGQGDVVVRVAQGRREARLPDIDRVVGSFADSLPVRATVHPAESLAELAPRVASELAGVVAHANASAMALAALGERGAAGPTGLTPAGFSFPLLPEGDAFEGLDLSEPQGGSASGFTRIGLIAFRFRGRLVGSLNAVASHLDADQARGLGGAWLHALRELALPAFEPARTLHGRILATCAQHPDRQAVGSLTYRALARRSAALANRLSGARIAVFAEPSEAAAIGVLAILRTGAAYVPLDPKWPDTRVAQVAAMGEPAAVVTTPELAERAGALGLDVHIVDEGEAEEGPDAEAELAYVMFTSGTSGRPKGVCMPHRASLNFLEWCTAAFGITEADRLVQTSSLAFGGHIRQLFAPLLHGASVHPVPSDLTRDPDALVRFLAAERITVWNSVPSLWTHLMDALERTGESDPLPDVRWVLLGGEAVPAAHVRRWRARFGTRIRLANLYGSTETAHNATWFEVTSDPDGAFTPIGFPRAGTPSTLVDVVDGIGEIVVGGAIAEGYHADPERTSEAFVTLPGLGRVYRTGDLGKRLPSGALVYVGRKDSQVQVYGNRVELGEVEFALCAHEGVAHALVVQRDDGRLHAAWEGTATGETLRPWLAERLPHYMVPSTWERVGQLPRTPAGKRDRRALGAAVAPAPIVEPQSSLVDALRRAWVSVLGLATPPSAEDDFFALGGDSLTLLEVLDRVRDAVRDSPSPLPLYRHRTLAAMAAYLAEHRPLATVQQGALSEVERGFLLAHRRSPSHPPVWTARLPVDGPLDPKAFLQAFAWVVQRHPLLRASWSLEGRTVHPGAAHPVQYDDLSVLDRTMQAQGLAQRWAELSALRLDPARPGPWRMRLIRLAPEQHELFVAMHHVAGDAASAWALTAELFDAHDAFAAGGHPAAAPLPAFDDVVPGVTAPDPWWDAALADLPPIDPAPREHDTRATFSLDATAWRRLQAAAHRRGLTPFALVATALFHALQADLGTHDVVVSTALETRPALARRVVGPFARALPVRLREAASPDRVSAALSEAAEHALAPPLQLVAAAGGSAPLARFFLTWLEPPPSDASLTARWSEARTHFATRSSETEVLVGALVDQGLHVHVDGASRAARVAQLLESGLRGWLGVEAALVVYLPDGVRAPVPEPVVVERVDAALANSELVLLPRHAGELVEGADLLAAVDAAVRASEARVVALAGMLPVLTGLGTRSVGRDNQVVTTGHAATVVAMVHTLQRVLAETGRSWTELRVGYLGFGAIGQAVRALAEDVLGSPKQTQVRDPRAADSVDALDVDLILGATSGGRALEVDTLEAGTIVIDDSFPRCFEDDAAKRRMTAARDVLLVGGGMLDPHGLHRQSPFPGADALRAQYGADWLPGCHAEAVLLAAHPEVGPTVGPVDLDRARVMWALVQRVGWTAPPLHLGGWLVPEGLAEELP